jgi:hypothetical protein
MNELNARTAALSIAKLQEMAKLLVDDLREGADEVFASVLRALEAQMPEAEFVAFAEALG